MTETDFSGKFMPQLNKRGHAIRVENVAESGTPDINYAFERAQGWIETKVAKGAFLYFELFQIPWFRKRLRATGGRHIWVLAQVGNHAHLYTASSIVEAKRESYKKWTRVRTSDLTPELTIDLNRPDWTPVLDILAEP